MKSISTVAILFLAFSLCNLSDKLTTKNDPPATTNTQAPTASTNTGESSATSNSSVARDDKAEVLNDLMELERRWKTANQKGDVTTLNSIYADEFSNVAENGKTYSKAEWISVWKRGDPSIKSWEISEERLESMAGERATLTFIITVNRKNSKVSRTRDTDTFIKRDGRWQVVASQSVKI